MIVLLTVLVQAVLPHVHENGFFHIPPVQTVIVNGNFRGGPTVQTVQQFRVSEEHGLLILLAGHLIVDVREAEGFGELIPYLKNTILPNALDGDGIVDLTRNAIPLLVLLHDGLNASYHTAYPPLTPHNRD